MRVRDHIPKPVKLTLRPVRSAVRVMGAVLNKGDAVECPACGGRFRRFLRFNGRDGARCQGCRALERHRLAVLYLRRYTDIFTAQVRVLHVAPEPALQKLLTANPRLEYVSADLDAGAMLRIDLTSAGLADDSFDVVLCSHVLEHVGDYRAAMREVFRILRPGGWAILDTPVDWSRETTFEDLSVTDPQQRERLFGQFDHLRVFGRDYPDVLREVGFDVTVDGFVLTEEEIRLHGLNLAQDHVYLCRKIPRWLCPPS